MAAFEITIQRQESGRWPIVAKWSERDGLLPLRSEGAFELREEELLGANTPSGYGTVLGRNLFRDQIRDAFVQAYAESDDRLHVLLVLEDPMLRTLRWERLCAPVDGNWRLLALDQRLPFSLYLPSLTTRRFPPIARRDLRALIVAAS